MRSALLRTSIPALGLVLSAALAAQACGSASPEAAPPPLPSTPAAAPEAPRAPAQPGTEAPAEAPAKHTGAADKPQAQQASEPKPARTPEKDDDPPARAGKESADGDRGLSLYELAKRGEATLPAQKPPAPKPAPKPVTPVPAPQPAPAPAASAAPKPSAPRGRVTVPSTARVRVDVPPGLQANLDADPRMQPWLNKVVSVIDGCFAKTQADNPGARGTIAVSVTMHENERPDADVRSLPPQLSSLVACATGSLMRTKMPLFTGPEGQRHNVNLRFGE